MDRNMLTINQNDEQIKNSKPAKSENFFKYCLMLSNAFSYLFLLILVICSGIFFSLNFLYSNYKIDIINNHYKISEQIPKAKKIYHEAITIVEEVKKEADPNSPDSLVKLIDKIKDISKDINNLTNNFSGDFDKIKNDISELTSKATEIKGSVDKILEQANKITSLPSNSSDIEQIKKSIEEVNKTTKELETKFQGISSKIAETTSKINQIVNNQSNDSLTKIREVQEIINKKLPVYEKNSDKLKWIINESNAIYNEFLVDEIDESYYWYVPYTLGGLIISNIMLVIVSYLTMMRLTKFKISLFYIFALASANPIVWVFMIISIFSRPFKNVN
ncbi:hypothetical protein [Mycoplasma putrefaciens]|nr:hypothetical protein [Mycoplasma putrefaciens]